MSPSVNSTSVPYLVQASENTIRPCFQYFGESSDEAYTVDPKVKYEEPVVFKVSGSSLTLSNYKFAYGNRMSDATDNPFTVQSQQGSSASPSGGQIASASPEYASSDMITRDVMYPGYYGGYYGGYGSYYEQVAYDPFEETSYKTACDEKGYYNYQTRGAWS